MRSFTLLLALPLPAPTAASPHPAGPGGAAHRPLFQKQEDKSKAASALTSEAAQGAARRGGAEPGHPKSQFHRQASFRPHGEGQDSSCPLATDEEFARRAWLDATGRIPPYEELLAFLRDQGRRISATSWSTNSSRAKHSSTSGPTTSKTFSAPAAAWARASICSTTGCGSG